MAGTAVLTIPEAKVITNKQLTSRFAAAVAMTALVGASAFAESRPSNETRTRRSDSRVEVRGDRVERNRASGGRIERDRSQDRSNRNDTAVTSPSRSRDSRDGARSRDRDGSRDNDRYRDNSRSTSNDRYGDSSRSRSNDRYGSNDRNRSSDRNRSNERYRGSNDRYRDNSRYNGNGSSRYGRQTFHYSGRVHRVYPYGGGYRVWLTGCQYPFYIPSAYYHRDRFRIGLTIALGGFYNSRGYYDYYDDYDRDRYYDVSTSRGELRGIVESVDYRRETFVVRNEATGSFVTVAHNDRGRDPVRAGDYVELGGDWNRSGVFDAYRVEIVDYDSRR
jgi:hypothetical protein